jgi:hypothetical protein
MGHAAVPEPPAPAAAPAAPAAAATTTRTASGSDDGHRGPSTRGRGQGDRPRYEGDGRGRGQEDRPRYEGDGRGRGRGGSYRGDYGRPGPSAPRTDSSYGGGSRGRQDYHGGGGGRGGYDGGRQYQQLQYQQHTQQYPPRDRPVRVSVPQHDYDFEAATAAFAKQEGRTGEATSAAAATAGDDGAASAAAVAPAYSKKSSFFDSISSNATDKAKGSATRLRLRPHRFRAHTDDVWMGGMAYRMQGRELRETERKQNLETFGQVRAYNSDGYRGGRGGGRGGYNNNNNNNSYGQRSSYRPRDDGRRPDGPAPQ